MVVIVIVVVVAVVVVVACCFFLLVFSESCRGLGFEVRVGLRAYASLEIPGDVVWKFKSFQIYRFTGREQRMKV